MRSADGNVKTRNGVTYLNSSYYPLEDVRMMKEEPDKTYPSNIEGLEDVRLFLYKDKLHFTASSKNITSDGKIVMTIGDYNPDSAKMTNISVIRPPRPSDCEKNWIHIPEYSLINTDAAKNKMNFIYGWHPLQIGAINSLFDFTKEEGKEDKPESDEIKVVQKLEIHTTYETPRFFSRFRGSSTICEYEGRLWCVAHFVKYSTPRVYLHSVVTFNRETMKPESYSLPFVFRKHAIEYCLGFHIKDGKMCFIFSQNDNEPVFITMPITNLRFLPIS